MKKRSRWTLGGLDADRSSAPSADGGVRMGDFRIINEIDDGRLVVLVVDIGA